MESSGLLLSENMAKSSTSASATTSSIQCPMENVTSTFQSLDTVRALHQTVVSLRSALEDAKYEIQRLRNQLSAQSEIKESLKERIIETEKNNEQQKESKSKEQNKEKLLKKASIKQQKSTKSSKLSEEEICIKETEDYQHHHHHHYHHQLQHIHFKIPENTESFSAPTCDLSSSTSKHPHYYHDNYHNHPNFGPTSSSTSSRKLPIVDNHRQKIVITPDIITVVTHPNSSSSSSLATADNNTNNISSKMGSKIDVKIKVMSNIKVDGSSSSNSFESTNNSGNQPESTRINNEESETLEGAIGGTETTINQTSSNKFHLQTTTEDNYNIQKDSDGSYIITHSSKDNLNVEDIENSQSEGDNNSVFMEDDDGNEQKVSETDDQQEEDNDENEQQITKLSSSQEVKISDQENKEEVDDIELIFSSEETRDPIQEDLVSISEYDPWQQPGKSGTPVLVKFASLPSDQSITMIKRKIHPTKLSTSTTYDVFLDSDQSTSGIQKQQQQQQQHKSIESTDSLDLQTSFKSSSLEKDNSVCDDEEQKNDELRPLDRDESLDFFNSNDYSLANNHRKWTNYNVLVETDISKCGIVEETTFEMYRRNTCPNPPAYKPFTLREGNYNTRHSPSSRFPSKYSRRLQQQQQQQYSQNINNSPGQISRPVYCGTKRSSPAQTNISALPTQWKSETQLTGNRYHLGGPCTLPSKFVPITRTGCPRHFSRISERTQETRRILLSDINFTSMVPELSRSADHLCQEENRPSETGKQSPRYYKGNFLKTPDYTAKGMTPSVSMTSPGVSQWTVNESSFGTQTIQTGESWCKRGDSFDSCKSYSTGGGGSRYSGLDRHHRSRSVPSIRCAICKLAHHGGIRTSESMHYTPRVTFQELNNRIRGSLPDLRHDCICSRRYCTSRTIFPIHGDSSGSTESLLDEADTFVRRSMDSAILADDMSFKRPNFRRMSENDIQRDYIPSKQSLPFLPKTAKCLKPGHLAKVISKNGRVVVGRVRYVGPLASIDKTNGTKTLVDDLYVGVQLQSKCGDCDGTFEGRKFFECEPQQGLFVPFKKVVMAWTS